MIQSAVKERFFGCKTSTDLEYSRRSSTFLHVTVDTKCFFFFSTRYDIVKQPILFSATLIWYGYEEWKNNTFHSYSMGWEG